MAAYWLYLPNDFRQFGQSLVAQAALSSNVFFWLKSGYFDSSGAVKPLLHTWSLAVEEQFYLLFPLLFLWTPLQSRKRLIGALMTIGVASFALSVWWSYSHPSAAFYLLPTRAWELALGAVVFLASSEQAAFRTGRSTAIWAGLAAIAYSALFFTAATRFPGAAALLPCAGTALVIWGSSHDESVTTRVLSLRPVVFIGQISYPLYLWHWPLLAMWRYAQPQPVLTFPATIALAAIAAAAATATYLFVESPVRRRRVLADDRRLVMLGVVSAAIFAGLGITIDRRQGVPSRLPESCNRLASPEVDPIVFVETTVNELRNGAVPILTGKAPVAGGHVDVLLWGDSHAAVLAPTVRASATAHVLTAAMLVHSSTAPLLDFWRESPYALSGADAREFAGGAIAYIRNHSVTHVILAAMWNSYSTDRGSDPRAPVGGAGAFDVQLSRTVTAIEAAGADVWIVLDTPSVDFDIPRALSRMCITNRDMEALWPSAARLRSKNAGANAAIESVRSSRAHVIDPFPAFVDRQDRVMLARGSRALFHDNAHLSATGAEILTPALAPVFR